ncbi:hypothetical protein BLNAU_12176 [Blattamonas nauphoetae]|uniref:Uncharacterized protein n=1 Tax=Blattamonas nauphoetae TaxID=2049346 RepID=A0ABQ9XRH8_9EUKA|nr:hypothetical protein BLNAU_12176 [Blattamonas nauphoetae]
MESSVSVSIISCSHHSSTESSSLLPLVSGPRLSFRSTQTICNEEGDSAEFGVGPLSIIGNGLNMKSNHLVVGTSPLFDFGTWSGNDLHVGCSVSLSGSSLTNMTSTPISSRRPPSCSSLTQRLIEVSVSESTNHLCGTSGVSLDWAGSSLLSNCTFLSCTTNAAPEPIAEPILDPSEDVDLHTAESERITLSQDFKDETESNPVWIISCAFSDLSTVSDYRGAAILMEYLRADLTIKNSTFERCHAPSSGGAIYCRQNSDSSGDLEFYFSLFYCQFSNNTAFNGGHMQIIYYHPVTIAQCTFGNSRSTKGTPFKQNDPIQFIVYGECRFDNSTLSDNEGGRTGGVIISQYLSTGKVVLTDVLFEDNVCTDPRIAMRVTDWVFYFDYGIDNNEFFDCFSTSAQPHCGMHQITQKFPDLIGPSIISVGQTVQENGNGDGFEVVLSFEGMFTGTSRKYDVTLEDADGTRLVAEDVSFSKTAGTVAFALNNPSVHSFSSSTEYTIVEVKKSHSQTTTNEFAVGEVEEPDWAWWHHTLESRADSMICLSFTTPAGPTLTNIKADLNGSNLNEAIVSVTVDSVVSGSFMLTVFDPSDSPDNDLTIDHFVFSSPTAPASSSHTVVIRPSGVLSYGKTYTVKTLSSSTLIITHISPSFQIPSPLRAASASLNLEIPNQIILNITASGFPSSTPITLTIVEVDENSVPTGSPFALTGTPTTIGDSTHILETRVETAKLQHAKRFEITQCDITGRKTVLDGRIIFRVPAPPKLTRIDCSFATTSNTTIHLILGGTDLPLDETFLVSLDGFENPIEVTITNTTEGSSAELSLGWPETLRFDTNYTLLSVIHKSDSAFSIPSTHLTLETDTRPNPLILYATYSANSDPKFCGAVERPCSSVDVAWLIVEAYSAQRVSLVLIKKTLLASQMIVESGQDVIVKQDLLPPTLVIPSTASLDDSAGFVDVAGTLLLEKVNIDVQVNALSFVLFDVKGEELTMNSVQLSGIPSSSDVVDEIEGLCSWETGLIKLHSSTCSLTSCVLSSIEMGEIWMELSHLSLISTQILSNGMRFSSFPSAQQDVMCKSGNISILPSSSDTSEDRWISSTSECSVVLNGSELKSPHFVPLLGVPPGHSKSKRGLINTVNIP